ncbi:glycoside hydrolase family 5 protein [Rhodopila sp.]|uniref:glycoside hydrolase family 5 protein n=1 Tax=Rhodopila sp. TaxID=2480087 RepID=UPI002C5922E2|nr:cellulase family glycosylhydrolase [Rhodopila sp.]HVZ08338.1 cellulase family glycosylhydrolase [Rhodopila sp.]
MVTFRRTLCRLACILLPLLAGGAPGRADPPPPLARGINITGWFRFPPSREPAALDSYLSDAALLDLRAAGLDFVRLAVDPDMVADAAGSEALLRAIGRIQRQGLAVIVSPHPVHWRLEAQPGRLRAFWQGMAPQLRALDPVRTVPEIVNEPVFPHDPAGWATLQHRVLGDIRAALPHATVVLTGQDWGSIKGLLALAPEADPDVVYSFHFYDPPELTTLAAYRAGLDRAALARLPFPAADRAGCGRAAAAAGDAPTRELMRYYCALGWTEAALRKPIDQAAAWARMHHARLLAGEFGASAALNPPARLAWLRAAGAAFRANGIAWALWGYDDVMGLNVPRPPPARPRLDPAVLAAIGLPAIGLPAIGLPAGRAEANAAQGRASPRQAQTCGQPQPRCATPGSGT